jgi:PAS domain S-box-containing protein
VGLRVTEKLIELTIEDSGTGVKPELREAIFERFRQGDGGADRQFSGTGLGLAIARDFVRMHNGTISVTDSELGGALFQVRIPVIDLQEKNGDIPQKKPLSVPDLNTLEGLIEELRLPVNPQRVAKKSRPAFSLRPRVLVVEDNPDMNRFIVQSLSSEYEVITAFDGKQGLEKALSEAPKLIVSDLMMPGFSGEQMIGEIRRYPQLREIPILLLSAKADEELKIRLLEESVQDFVTKPFSEKDLLARVRNLIAVEQSREELRQAERIKREIVEESNRDLQARFQQLSGLFEQTPSFMAVLRSPEHIFEIANAAFYKLIGYREIIGKNMQEAIPEATGQGFLTLLDGVYKTGKTYTGTGVPLSLQRTGKDSLEQRYVDFVYQPLWDNDRQVVGIFVEGHDVTEHKKAEELLQTANKRKDEFLRLWPMNCVIHSPQSSMQQ